MSKEIFNAIFCGALFVTGLPNGWAQNSSLPSCAPTALQRDWNMCRYKEDLGGGLVIDHEYRNGVPYFATGRQYSEGTFLLVDKFSSSQDLDMGLMDMRGGRVYIDLAGLNVNDTKRIFSVIFDFPTGYRMSKRTSIRSFLVKLTADCSNQKILPTQVSGFYGVMGQGDSAPMEMPLASKSITVTDLEQNSDLVSAFKNVMGSVCAPDIVTQVNSARQRIESPKVQTSKPIAPDTRRRLALVIGNNSYQSMATLNNAVNDAREMTKALKQVNFEVLSYENLDKRRMEDVMREFVGKLGRNDVGLFYFSGHGIQHDNKNYLIPVRENVKKTSDVPYEGVDVDRIMANLKDAQNSMNIVILDACRSTLSDSRGGLSRGLTVIEAPQGSIIAFATSPGKTAADGDGGNSPYTKNLIRAMQLKGVQIEQVFKEVRQAVIKETNGEQTPSETSYLVGDFYFRP